MIKRRAIRTVNGPVEVTGGGVVIAGFRRSAAVMETWTDEQLAEIGVETLQEAEAPAFGMRRTGVARLEIVDDAILEMFDLEPVPLDELKGQLHDGVRAKRWERETAGLEVGGEVIRTDEKSQAKISGALQLLDKQPEREAIRWEAQPRQYVTIPRLQMIALGVAVGDYVQRCFDHSSELADQIEAAADAQALSEIDIEGGWPATAG